MDIIDSKILKALQTNGRLKHTELARQLDIAQSTLLERVRKLEEQDMILGYRAVLDLEKIGLTVQAFISVTMSQHEAEIIEEFERELTKIPNVRACYHMTGRVDYLLQVVVRDIEHLRSLIKNQITALPGFGKSETSVIFSEIKAYDDWSIEDEI